MLPETRPVLCQAAVQELQLAPAIFTFATCSHTRTNDTWLLEAGDNASVSSGFEGDSGSVGRTPCRPSSQLRRQLSAAFSASASEVNHIDCLRTGFWPLARVYIKRRSDFPVLVSSDTLGTEVRSHRCLVGALGGMLCVRQHQCDHVATAKQTQI